ncbi:hypothetical protein DL96DRAFT_1580333 [Flagelloscypha sp. PMI_526]|nr:hypothetical protein DL96DRAFT_1580333 [Flagelloscypha sp. PMI_526]
MSKLGGSGHPTFAASAFVSLFVESVLYGLFALTYAISTYALVRRRSVWTRSRWVLLLVSTVMFFFATVHLIINFWRDYNAFLSSSNPQMWLVNRGTRTGEYVGKNVLWHAQIILGDAFLIWRLFIVYSRKRLVWIPFFTGFIASIITAIGALVQQTMRDPKVSIFSSAYKDWPLSFFVLSLFVNTGSSLLIAFRVWRVHRQATTIRTSGLLRVAAIVIEAAGAYAASILVTFVLYFVNSGALKITMDVTMQLVGVSFCGIVASVNFGFTSPREDEQTYPQLPSSIRFDTLPPETGMEWPSYDPLAVHQDATSKRAMPQSSLRPTREEKTLSDETAV